MAGLRNGELRKISIFFFFSSRRRHTRCSRDWSSDVCSSDLSPDVRIAALKALLRLDAGQAGPHLAAAIRGPDRAVRRGASLLALALTGSAIGRAAWRGRG